MGAPENRYTGSSRFPMRPLSTAPILRSNQQVLAAGRPPDCTRELTWITLSHDIPDWKRSLAALFVQAGEALRAEGE